MLLVCGSATSVTTRQGVATRTLRTGGAVAGVLLFIPAWLKRFGTEIAVTDHRVIYKTGLVQRDTTEINMAKIESVDVSQSILGRVFGFGTLTIRGTGETIEALRNIASPLQFRNAIMVR